MMLRSAIRKCNLYLLYFLRGNGFPVKTSVGGEQFWRLTVLKSQYAVLITKIPTLVVEMLAIAMFSAIEHAWVVFIY